MKTIKALLLTILYVVIYYFFQFTAGGIVGLAVVFINILSSRPKNVDEMFGKVMTKEIGNTLCITIVVSAIMAYLVFWGIFLIRGKKISKICNFKKVKISYGVIAAILGLSVCFMNSYLITCLNKIEYFHYQIEKYEINNIMLSEANVVLLVLGVVVTAPLIEEVIFRGLIFDELKPVMPVFLVIIIQGLGFGAFHLNLVQFIYASILGIIFGLVYNWTKNIWIPIILHASNNLMAVIALKLSGVEESTEPGVYVFITALAVTILLCFFFYRKREADYAVSIINQEEENNQGI